MGNQQPVARISRRRDSSERIPSLPDIPVSPSASVNKTRSTNLLKETQSLEVSLGQELELSFGNNLEVGLGEELEISLGHDLDSDTPQTHQAEFEEEVVTLDFTDFEEEDDQDMIPSPVFHADGITYKRWYGQGEAIGFGQEIESQMRPRSKSQPKSINKPNQEIPMKLRMSVIPTYHGRVHNLIAIQNLDNKHEMKKEQVIRGHPEDWSKKRALPENLVVIKSPAKDPESQDDKPENMSNLEKNGESSDHPMAANNVDKEVETEKLQEQRTSTPSKSYPKRSTRPPSVPKIVTPPRMQQTQSEPSSPNLGYSLIQHENSSLSPPRGQIITEAQIELHSPKTDQDQVEDIIPDKHQTASSPDEVPNSTQRSPKQQSGVDPENDAVTNTPQPVQNLLRKSAKKNKAVKRQAPDVPKPKTDVETHMTRPLESTEPHTMQYSITQLPAPDEKLPVTKITTADVEPVVSTEPDHDVSFTESLQTDLERTLQQLHDDLASSEIIEPSAESRVPLPTKPPTPPRTLKRRVDAYPKHPQPSKVEYDNRVMANSAEQKDYMRSHSVGQNYQRKIPANDAMTQKPRLSEPGNLSKGMVQNRHKGSRQLPRITFYPQNSVARDSGHATKTTGTGFDAPQDVDFDDDFDQDDKAYQEQNQSVFVDPRSPGRWVLSDDERYSRSFPFLETAPKMDAYWEPVPDYDLDADTLSECVPHQSQLNGPRHSSLQSSSHYQEIPVMLTQDFDPKNFVDKTPELDTTGRQIPPWKRLLVARQMAERAQREAEELKKKEQEEAKYKHMPAWKRALIEKRSSPESKTSSPDEHSALDSDGLPASPWQQIRMKAATTVQ